MNEDIDYIWIDESNYEFFSGVLSKQYLKGGENVCFGACDGDGVVCGSLCYCLTRRSC